MACDPAYSCCEFPVPSDPVPYMVGPDACKAEWEDEEYAYAVECMELSSESPICYCLKV